VKARVSVNEMVEAWLSSPVGHVPLLPFEMERLRVMVEEDEAAGLAWQNTCDVASAYLEEEVEALTPTPLMEYRNDNPQATINNNRVARFLSGWSACAWKAAVVGDERALGRAAECLDAITRVHGKYGGVMIVPNPDSTPNRVYYHSICGFRVESIIVLVELMRCAGFEDRAGLEELVRRLIALSEMAVDGCEYLVDQDVPYWNGDICGGAGLLSTASVLPDHPDAGKWRELGWRNVEGFFNEKNFLKDGSFHEAFPCAEAYGLGFLFTALQVLRGRDGFDVSTLNLSPSRTLKASMEWHMKVASPLGELPCINDTSAYEACMGENNAASSHLLVMGQWVGLPEVWKAFRAEDYQLQLYVHAYRPEVISESESQSLLMKDVGWSFIRSGSGKSAFQVMFDHGLHHSSHSMPQCLTFDMICEGHHWLVNSGCAPHYCTYDEQNTWHRRTRAGNCIALDGEDIPAGTKGELLEWEAEGNITALRACHRGYGHTLHERRLIYREGGPLVVVDRLIPNDDHDHLGTVYWHVNAEVVAREDQRWTFGDTIGNSLVVLSEQITPDTELCEGLCGGLGGRDRQVGRLPEAQAVNPGSEGWRFVPYFELDVEVPVNGLTLVTGFVPLVAGSRSDYKMVREPGKVRVVLEKDVVMEVELES
jgi:hypothetical protein